MRRKLLCSLTCLISVVFLLSALAESPVGTVGGKGSLEISGSPVNLTALSSLPLAPGDTIISLSDKSRVLLEKNSQAKVEGSGQKLSIYLLKGGLSYKMSPQSQIKIFAQNQEMRSPLQTAGSVSLASGAAISSSKASPDLQMLTAAPTAQKAKSPKNCQDDPCDKDCGKGNDPKCQ